MLDQLLAADGVTEINRLKGRLGFMALHGGLEKATYEIAANAATASGSSLYSVRQPGSMYWHVPSIQFDPAHSHVLKTYLDHVGVVLSVHGFGRPGMEASILLGGSNRSLAGRIASALRVEGLDVIDELDAIPASLRGTNARNPVNLPEFGGVQVEIGHYLRRDALTPARIVAVLGHVASIEMRSLCARSEC